jgi:Chondroitinase B
MLWSQEELPMERRHASAGKRGQALASVMLLLIMVFALAHTAKGATLKVSSLSALQTAVNNAAAGDVVVLANGTYSNNTLTIGTSNITVRAETPGGVYLNGSNAIVISGNYITFSGFQFTQGSIPGFVIDVSGSHNLLTQLNFNGYSAQKYIVLQDGTQYNEISFSNFENKPVTAPIGNLIHVAAHSTIPGYHKIRYSSFQNMPGNGGDNGNEAIRLSNGAQSTYISRTVVEFNYFTNTGSGDSEAVSVKCRENTLRYNTFRNNPDAMMVFRNGNDNIAYGNSFIDAGGIRVKEANNIYVYNNYFERSGVGGTMNAVTYDYISPNLKNINFIHNTFVESGLIDLSSGATLNTWANNVFDKSSGSIFTGSTAGISWAGNIYNGSLGVPAPSTGMQIANPQLALNSEGYFGLSALSPAIDAASAGYPLIPVIPGVDGDFALAHDLSGQTRNTPKDTGADELDGANPQFGPYRNRPLRLADVGPSYLGGPGATPPPDAAPVLNPPTVVSATGVDLSWSNFATNATGIRILRCSGATCSPAASIASLASTASSYADRSVAAGTSYGYSVEAYNTGGAKVSNVAYATTPQPPPAVPAAPVLAVGSASKSTLTLTWTQNTAVPVTGFDILRCTGSGCTPGTVIGSVGSATRSFKNSGLASVTTYTYQVRAKNGGGSTLSNIASGKTK